MRVRGLLPGPTVAGMAARREIVAAADLAAPDAQNLQIGGARWWAPAPDRARMRRKPRSHGHPPVLQPQETALPPGPNLGDARFQIPEPRSRGSPRTLCGDRRDTTSVNSSSGSTSCCEDVDPTRGTRNIGTDSDPMRLRETRLPGRQGGSRKRDLSQLMFEPSCYVHNTIATRAQRASHGQRSGQVRSICQTRRWMVKLASLRQFWLILPEATAIGIRLSHASREGSALGRPLSNTW